MAYKYTAHKYHKTLQVHSFYGIEHVNNANINHYLDKEMMYHDQWFQKFL